VLVDIAVVIVDTGTCVTGDFILSNLFTPFSVAVTVNVV
jgi:hypothetical protein